MSIITDCLKVEAICDLSPYVQHTEVCVLSFINMFPFANSSSFYIVNEKHEKISHLPLLLL